LRAGKSGAAAITHFDASGFSARIGAEVKNFQPENIITDRKLLKFASPSHGFALAAAEEAFERCRHPARAGDSQSVGLQRRSRDEAITYRDLEAVHNFCAPEGDFNPDGAFGPDVPRRIRSRFARNQTNCGPRAAHAALRHFGLRNRRAYRVRFPAVKRSARRSRRCAAA